jgi:hypothetical protein
MISTVGTTVAKERYNADYLPAKSVITQRTYLLMVSQKEIRWLSKNFAPQGVVVVQG